MFLYCMESIKLEIKEKEDYTPAEKQVFSHMTLFGEYTVVGSGALKEIQYASDYDLFEKVKLPRTVLSFTEILDLFRKKFQHAYESKTIWITDFKCGVQRGGIPIRWTRQDIIRGYKTIEDTKRFFVDCLQQESRIKQDVVALVDGELKEFSEIYLFTFNKFENERTQDRQMLETGLLLDVKNYKEEGNKFKALKRLFAYFRLKNTHQLQVGQMFKFFNSETGKLNAQKNDLEIIVNWIEQKFRPVSKRLVVTYIRTHYPQITIPASLDLSRIVEILNADIKILNAEIQKQTIEWISKKKIIARYI